MRCGDLRESYLEDEKIFQTVFVKCWLGVLALFLLALPFLGNAYMLYVANVIGFAVIAAVVYEKVVTDWSVFVCGVPLQPDTPVK